MNNIFVSVEEFLASDNTEEAREKIERSIISLQKVDSTIRDFAGVLALGSQTGLEIGLGVLARKLIHKDSEEVSNDVLWLLLSAVLSRTDIAYDSPSRISILALASFIEDWQAPLFSLLTPKLDNVLEVNLERGNTLLAEQTLDFLATWGEKYAKILRTTKQLKKLKLLTGSVLASVDELDLKEEWTQGLTNFFRTARKKKSLDQRIWSAGSEMLKNMYSVRTLDMDDNPNNVRVKYQLNQFILSSLAALGSINNNNNGLSLAVRIETLQKNDSWSVMATAIDKIERLFQEIADQTFERKTKLPTFTPAQAIPGSWTIILHLHLSPNQSTSLTQALDYLVQEENSGDERNLLANKWEYYATKLKEEGLRVDLASSSNNQQLSLSSFLSTEEVDITGFTEHKKDRIRVLSHDIPQADSLERVIHFSSLLIQYPSSPKTVREKFLEDEISTRQFYYYQKAVEILGLMDERKRPTNACFILGRLPDNSKIKFLANQFMLSEVGSAWFRWEDANDIPDLQPERAVEFLREVSPSLKEDTLVRRAQTLQAWLHKFLENR